MNWIRVGDALPEHPKALAAGPEAMWLFIAANCYCNRLQTDGIVPTVQISRLTTHKNGMKLANRLVEVGLFEAVEDGFYVVKYEEWQQTSSEIQRIRELKREAGRRGGLAKAKHSASTVLKQNASTDVAGWSTKKKKQEIEEKEPKDKSGAAHTDAPLFESFWAEYPPQKNGSKPEKKLAHDQWQRLNPTERQRAMNSVQHYKAHLRQTDQFSKHAFRYLRDRSFESYQSPPKEIVNPPPKGTNARNFDSVIQRLGVANGIDGSSANHEVPLRGLPQGRLE